MEVIPCMFLSFTPQSFVVHLMKIVEKKGHLRTLFFYGSDSELK